MLPKRPEMAINGLEKVRFYTDYCRLKQKENASRRFGEYRNTAIQD